MDEKQILNHLKQLMIDIAQSPRWNNPDSPARSHIAHIGERVNSSESMQGFRKKEDYLLLLDITSIYEECLNDDWLPFEIFGLELNLARQFVNEILIKYDEITYGQWTLTIREIYNKINNTL